jgi:hypothetical protein
MRFHSSIDLQKVGPPHLGESPCVGRCCSFAPAWTRASTHDHRFGLLLLVTRQQCEGCGWGLQLRCRGPAVSAQGLWGTAAALLSAKSRTAFNSPCSSRHAHPAAMCAALFLLKEALRHCCLVSSAVLAASEGTSHCGLSCCMISTLRLLVLLCFSCRSMTVFLWRDVLQLMQVVLDPLRWLQKDQSSALMPISDCVVRCLPSGTSSLIIDSGG